MTDRVTANTAPLTGYDDLVSSSKRKHEPDSESARGRRGSGTGARGRQGATVEGTPGRRHERTATGASSTERDQGRGKTSWKGREHREGTG